MGRVQAVPCARRRQVTNRPRNSDAGQSGGEREDAKAQSRSASRRKREERKTGESTFQKLYPRCPLSFNKLAGAGAAVFISCKTACALSPPRSFSRQRYA